MPLLAEIKEILKLEKLDGYFLPRNNMFLGEDIHPAENKILKLTGFSGSAGTLLIKTQGRSILFVDGRYALQAPLETDSQEIEVVCTAQTPMLKWLQENLPQKFRLGYNPQCLSIKDVEQFQQKLPDIQWVATAEKVEPSMPLIKGRIFEHDIEFSGISREEKIGAVLDFLAPTDAAGWLFCAADSVSWLLNLRAKCLPDTPIIRGYVLIERNGNTTLFGGNLDFGNKEYPLSTYPLEALENVLKKFKKQSLYIDEYKTPQLIKTLFAKYKIEALHHKDIAETAKAIKNRIELEGIRRAHIRDGVAVVNFLYWLENNGLGKTEMEIVAELHNFRQKQEHYFSESFETIAAFGSNGAIVHYQPSTKSNKALQNGSLLLLDSGAQYYDGTTDITRTLAIGEPTEEMKQNYTTVLKGHINISRAVFPQGTSGQSLDALARLPLWKQGLNYAHGTGHGVGCFLNVHEGPQGISTSYSPYPLSVGMITSIEPGYYKEGCYGIRIENLAEIVESKQKGMLCFSPLTLVPYDRKLINKAQLTPAEISWINDYHARVFAALSPKIIGATKDWLKKACAKL